MKVTQKVVYSTERACSSVLVEAQRPRSRRRQAPGIQAVTGGRAGSAEREAIVAAAVACTLGSVTVPSLASVYHEFALKKHMDTSVHEQARAAARPPPRPRRWTARRRAAHACCVCCVNGWEPLVVRLLNGFVVWSADAEFGAFQHWLLGDRQQPCQ